VKFNLLVAASALVVGLGMNGAAFASGQGGQGGSDPSKDPTTNAAAAVALTGQDGAVLFDFAKGTDGANTLGTVGGTGLFNVQQNNGANSILQDQNTLGAVLDCSCSTTGNVYAASLAASSQSALVLGDQSIGAVDKGGSGKSSSSGFIFAAGGEQSSGGGHKTTTTSGTSGTSGNNHPDSQTNDPTTTTSSAGGGEQSAGFLLLAGGQQKNSYSWYNTAVQSTNYAASIGGTGLVNVSQNNGNNSMLQSGNTVAAIIGAP
jgi:hypothetical protein